MFSEEDDFLGIDTWAPQGYVSAKDEQVMYYHSVTANVRIRELAYSWNNNFTAAGRDRGDEVYGGNSFQYIPTEVEVGAAIAMRNMATADVLPVQANSPGMAQLLQSLYQRTAQFWQDIRNASGTGW